MNWLDFICLWFGYVVLGGIALLLSILGLLLGLMELDILWHRVTGKPNPMDDHPIYPSEPQYTCPRCQGAGCITEDEMDTPHDW